jgi:hypothetical protein
MAQKESLSLCEKAVAQFDAAVEKINPEKEI